MAHPHFLLQDWLNWWENLLILWQSGGWQALYNASRNFNAEPLRDTGNLVTGAGAGATVTKEAFRDLTGLPASDKPAEDGHEAIGALLWEYLKEVYEWIFSGSEEEQQK